MVNAGPRIIAWQGSVIPSLNVPHQAERAMTAPFAIHLVPVAGFTGLMAVAAFEDFRRLVIPNPLILALCVLWPFYLAIAPKLGLGLGRACRRLRRGGLCRRRSAVRSRTDRRR